MSDTARKVERTTVYTRRIGESYYVVCKLEWPGGERFEHRVNGKVLAKELWLAQREADKVAAAKLLSSS